MGRKRKRLYITLSPEAIAKLESMCFEGGKSDRIEQLINAEYERREKKRSGIPTTVDVMKIPLKSGLAEKISNLCDHYGITPATLIEKGLHELVENVNAQTIAKTNR